jgi:hypothetical protein
MSILQYDENIEKSSNCEQCLIDFKEDCERCSLCNLDLKLLKCSSCYRNCNNYLNGYKDIDDCGCCKSCDDYIDDNPYDPYWEQIANEFSSSKEYKALKRKGKLDDSDAYEIAYEKYQANYESWPKMRRRMAKKDKWSLSQDPSTSGSAELNKDF